MLQKHKLLGARKRRNGWMTRVSAQTLEIQIDPRQTELKRRTFYFRSIYHTLIMYQALC